MEIGDLVTYVGEACEVIGYVDDGIIEIQNGNGDIVSVETLEVSKSETV